MHDEEEEKILYKEPKHRIVLHVYDDESKEFTSLTTYHGMIRIYSSHTWPSRIFWSLVVVTCLVLFILHSGLMLQFYHSKPTFRKFTHEIMEREDLPDVTVCRENGFKDKLWKKYNLTDYGVNVISRILRHEYLDEKERAIMNRLHKKLSVEEIYTNYSLACRELFSSLQVGGSRIEPCKYAQKIMTEYGTCWSLGRWPTKRPNERVRIQVRNPGAKSNVIVHVHSRLVPPSISAKGIHVPPNRTAHMIVHPNIVDYLEIGSWGTCSKEWDKSIPAKHDYTLTHCFRYCLAAQFLKGCGCAPFHINHFGNTTCTLIKMNRCRTGKPLDGATCKCKPQCNRPRYIVKRPTYVKSSPRKVNITEIIIDFPSNKLVRIKQYKRFQATDLLSYVAGSMGLFLGMSCVTLLEIFMYLFKTVTGSFSDQRHFAFFENMMGDKPSPKPTLAKKITLDTRRSKDSIASESDSGESVVEENIGILVGKDRKPSVFQMPETRIHPLPRNKLLDRVRSGTSSSAGSGARPTRTFSNSMPDPNNSQTRRRLSHFPGIGF